MLLSSHFPSALQPERVFLLIHRRPKSNLVTPITRRDPLRPLLHRGLLNLSLCMLLNICILKSPPPHVFGVNRELPHHLCSTTKSNYASCGMALLSLNKPEHTQASLQIVMFTLGRNSSGTQHGISATAVFFFVNPIRYSYSAEHRV